MTISPLLSTFIWLFLGTLTSYIAKKRNRSPIYWFFIGAFLGVIGLVILYLLPSKSKGLQLQPALNKDLPDPKSYSEFSLPPSKKPGSDPKKEQLWYYLDNDNNQFGPMSLCGLKKSWVDDLMTGQTYIWCEEMEDWKHLEDLPEIHSHVRGASY